MIPDRGAAKPCRTGIGCGEARAHDEHERPRTDVDRETLPRILDLPVDALALGRSTLTHVRMNLLDDADWVERTWPPEREGYRWRRKRIAGENLGASLYELEPGESTFPYHYELGNDELLVVVEGRPTLRSPHGERVLETGDCIHFPTGPEGAHALTNQSDETARVLLVSNFALPRAFVQVDSGKLGVMCLPPQVGRCLTIVASALETGELWA